MLHDPSSALKLSSILCFAVLGLLPPAAGQIPINGNIQDGAGGPLAGGQVYVVTSSLTVPAGATLTVGAGAIVKFQPTRQLTVQGTLIVNGTAAQPVHFTSHADDSVGGDSNANGPSAGQPGDWRGIVFAAAADGSMLTHAVIRFGGNAGFPLVDTLADIALTDCTLASGSGNALDLNNSPVAVAVTGGIISGNAGTAIANAHIDSVAGIAGVTVTGNGGNFLRVTAGTLGADRTIGAPNCPGGALVFATALNVPAGRTLIVEEGAVLKFGASLQLVVSGTLVTGGTAVNLVAFTSLADDAFGGDTNGDGPSAGVPGGWRGISFAATSDASSLAGTQVRFAGASGFSAVEIVDADVALTDCVIAFSATTGMDLNATPAAPQVTGCTFDGNALDAVAGVTIGAVPGFANNTAAGNGRDVLAVVNGATAGDLTVGPQNGLGGVIVFATAIQVPASRTLTIQAGSILKFEANHQVVVSGTLATSGTSTNPVVFTALADDAFGGDSNGDGASAGAPGSWRGLSFTATSTACSLARTQVRFAGGSGFGAIEAATSGLAIADSVVAFSAAHGMDLNLTPSQPQVTRCRFEGNALDAVAAATIGAVPGFVGNIATGNGRDVLRVLNGALAADLAIGPENMIGGSIVCDDAITVGAAHRLSLRAGTVLKFGPSRSLSVAGALDVSGTAHEPVVLSSVADDSAGGDSNGNGPSSGAPGDWRGVAIGASAGVSRIEHLLVRFGGGSGFPAFANDSPAVAARSLRVEKSLAAGIRASALAGDAANWVAFDCAGAGISLTGGAFAVVHATVAACGGAGISANAAYTGLLVNSIARGNAGGNVSGFGAGRLLHCNGSAAHAGSNGNIDADPLFADASPAAGDLRLQSGSPCLNTASVAAAVAVVKDFDESSRLLDHDLSGAMLPDMGAFERAAYAMTTIGAPRLGATVTLAVDGAAPGFSVYGFGALDATELVPPFGFVTLGALANVVTIPFFVPTGSALPLFVPDEPALLGLPLGIQTLSWPAANPAAGNITNLLRVTIRP